MPQRKLFVPFDPRVKRAQVTVVDEAGGMRRLVKGAFAYITVLAQTSPAAHANAAELEAEAFRVLGVALSTPGLGHAGRATSDRAACRRHRVCVLGRRSCHRAVAGLCHILMRRCR
jgi:magnesium-transporting ATPase (P-type)